MKCRHNKVKFYNLDNLESCAKSVSSGYTTLDIFAIPLAVSLHSQPFARPSISNNFFTFCVWRNSSMMMFSLVFKSFLGQRLKIRNTIASLEPVPRHTLGWPRKTYQVLYLRSLPPSDHDWASTNLINSYSGTSIRSATNTFSIETVRVLMQFYIIIKVVSVDLGAD